MIENEKYEKASRIITDYIKENNYVFKDFKEEKKSYKDFQSRFSPEILKNLEGENILNYIFIHDSDRKNLCYALEFDKKYICGGGIKGGSSYKYSLYKNTDTGKWIYGTSAKNKVIISDDEAIKEGSKIRDVLIKGAEIISSSKLETVKDYETLDDKLNETFKNVLIPHSTVWVQKYYKMIFPEKFVNIHSNVMKKERLNPLGIEINPKTYAADEQMILIARNAGIDINTFVDIVFKLESNIIIDDDLPSENKSEKNVWVIAPGENAELLDYFKENNLIAIGWGDLGDLNQYKSRKEMINILDKKYPTSTVQKNNSKALCDFSKVMSIGDIVFLKRGMDKVLGVGIVTSDYKYINDIPKDYNNVREVKWLKFADYKIKDPDLRFAQKVLTNITNINNEKFTGNDYYLRLAHEYGFEIEDYLFESENPKYDKEDFLNDVLFLGKDYDELINMLKRKKNIILQGSPGVGKTFIAKRLAYSIIGFKDDEKIEFIQFHQNYSYEDFIQGYRPKEKGFDLNNGVFYKFSKKAMADPDNNYYFIIDEINRGNISKIFGELMMLIEEDKRGENFSINLTYDSENKFYVPENLYIIGMMNTADRSLAIIDYALRRRFVFYTVDPLFDNDYKNNDMFKDYLISKGASDELSSHIINKFKALNELILNDDDLGYGFRIGHSYFTGSGTYDKDWYESILKYEIKPLLNEYWFDDLEKASQEFEKLQL